MANSILGTRSPNGPVGVRGVADSGELSMMTSGILSGFSVSVGSGFSLNVGGVAGVQDVAVARNSAGESDLLVGNGTRMTFTLPNPPTTSGQSQMHSLVVWKDSTVVSDVNDGLDAVGYQVVSGTVVSGTAVPPTVAAIRAAIPNGSTAFFSIIANALLRYGDPAPVSGNIAVVPSVIVTSHGGTGNANGKSPSASTADKLTNSSNFRVDLNKNTAAAFTGNNSMDGTFGTINILPANSGGLGSKFGIIPYTANTAINDLFTGGTCSGGAITTQRAYISQITPMRSYAPRNLPSDPLYGIPGQIECQGIFRPFDTVSGTVTPTAIGNLFALDWSATWDPDFTFELYGVTWYINPINFWRESDVWAFTEGGSWTDIINSTIYTYTPDNTLRGRVFLADNSPSLTSLSQIAFLIRFLFQTSS